MLLITLNQDLSQVEFHAPFLFSCIHSKIFNYFSLRSAQSAQPASKKQDSVPSKSEPVSAPVQVYTKKEDRREPLRGFKRAMVRSMNEAWQKIPHFGYKDEVWTLNSNFGFWIQTTYLTLSFEIMADFHEPID